LYLLCFVLTAALAVSCGEIKVARPVAPVPETEPIPDADLARMHEIRDAVARIRGLPVNDDIDEGIVSRPDFRDFLESQFLLYGGMQRLMDDALTVSFQMMGILEAHESLAEEREDAYGEGILGFYADDSNTLVVLGDVFGEDELAESVIAHEYVHSLQDRAFDLYELRERAFGLLSEYSSTVSCVIEGDAVLTHYLYMADKYGGEWAEALEALAAGDESLADLRELQRYFAFDYRECLTFVHTIWKQGGWEAINRLYESPPASTEQILHPEKYLAGEGPKLARSIDVGDSIGNAWRQVVTGAFGEFDLYLYLRAGGVEEAEARGVAAGWGGGGISLYTSLPDAIGKVDDVVTHFAIVWDSADDLAEFETSYERVIANLGFEGPRRSGSGEWTWSAARRGEYGSAIWDRSALRVDVVFGTDEQAVRASIDALREYAQRSTR
jgi:hypothetical protein